MNGIYFASSTSVPLWAECNRIYMGWSQPQYQLRGQWSGRTVSRSSFPSYTVHILMNLFSKWVYNSSFTTFFFKPFLKNQVLFRCKAILDIFACFRSISPFTYNISIGLVRDEWISGEQFTSSWKQWKWIYIVIERSEILLTFRATKKIYWLEG